MKNSPALRVEEEDILKAVRGSGGYVTRIAKKLGIARTHFYWLMNNKYPSIKEALQDEREKQLDHAEGILQAQINEGNITALIFFLKTQGKSRGYIERVESEFSVDNSLKDLLLELKKLG